MTTDEGGRLPDPPGHGFVLPNILKVEIRAIHFEAPKHRNFSSALRDSRDAVEFVVDTDGPIPVRSLGPVLYVGEVPIMEVSEVGPNRYRFVAMTRKNLKEDTTIRLGWTGQPPAERREFRYRHPTGDASQD